MPTTPPSLDFDHKKGFEIPTKHKEAIRQLYRFGKVPIPFLMQRYGLGDTTIKKILLYEKPERKRPRRTGRPQLLTEARLDEVILFLSESWEDRIMQYDILIQELNLKCKADTLKHRLHERGYFRCTACQKPYLTLKQVTARFLWAITHMFWTVEWLKVLWSDEVTFLVGGRTAKQKVTRKKGERTCETCI